jgi:Spy/CpxP family protein refolding chaperone
VTAVAALGAVVGLKAYAHVGGFGGWHRGGFMHGPVDPAQLDAHLDRMLKHLYVEIDATEPQKQALAPIVKAAVRDLLPLRERLHATRDQAVALLTQPTIDRAAIESLRASQLALVEQASKRLAQALGDVADVLTPEQRKAIAEHMAHRHGPRG